MALVPQENHVLVRSVNFAIGRVCSYFLLRARCHRVLPCCLTLPLPFYTLPYYTTLALALLNAFNI